MAFGGANPQHGTPPARQAWAWCWCYCCGRKLELFESLVRPREEAAYGCCGRTWKVEEPQPRALHDGLDARLEDLQDVAREALALLERWPARRPKGLKLVVERLRARVTKRA